MNSKKIAFHLQKAIDHLTKLVNLMNDEKPIKKKRKKRK
jgi:hypothetical protein